MNYLLSIIIPTKDRYKYLKECLKSIVNLKSEDVEIVVQDNTEDNNEILSYIEEVLNWPHIKYYHEKGKLSQTENSDRALCKATGKYVCYIGDDDTITYQMINVVQYLDNKDIESCTFQVAKYYWTDVVFKHIKYPSLSFPQNKPTIKQINTMDELFRCLRKGAASIGKMPKVYHGIVAKSSLDMVFEKTGSYFPGPSPDMANATALSFVVKRHFWVGIPLMVSGYSYKSAGGMGVRGAHSAKIKDVAQLPIGTEENWEKEIPKIWLGSTIWAESCVKALRAMNEINKISRINWCYLYATMLVFDIKYLDYIKPFIKPWTNKLKVIFWGAILLLNRTKSFISNLISAKLRISNKKTFNDIETLEEAMNILDAYIREEELINILK